MIFMMKHKSSRRWRDIINELGERKISLENIVLEEKGQGLADFFKEKDISFKEAVGLRQYAKAIVTGDTRSAEFLRDTSGEKPSTEVHLHQSTSPLQELSVEELRDLLALYKEKDDSEK